MKSKKIRIIVISIIAMIAVVVAICLSVLFQQSKNSVHDEGTAELISSEQWISNSDGQKHTTSLYSFGTTAQSVQEELPANIKLEHKFVDDIPIYEMYPADLKNGKIIFFLHGQLSRKEEYLYEMMGYAEEGYLCVCVDLEGHGERITEEKIMALQITADTGKDLDTLIQYYYTKDYADETNFSILGLSQGGSVAYWYVAFGSYHPKAIIVGCSTPDYSYFLDDSCIKNGEIVDSVWNEETIESFLTENNPISRIEYFYSVAILSGNSFDDPIVSYQGSEELEKKLKDAGNTNAYFYYFDGIGHNVSEDFIRKVLPFLKTQLN